MPARLRHFAVRARLEAHGHARRIRESGFEAAAVAWLESAPPPIEGAGGEPHEVSVIVRDLDSGHEHCFRLDLDTGEAAGGC